MEAKRIPLQRAQRQLATIWLAGAGSLFALVVAQSLTTTKYGERTEDAWAWFLPTVMPTTSLIVSALVAGARRPAADAEQVDAFVFRVARVASLGYLLLVALTFVVEPLTELSILALMQRSNLWLGPAQGVVAAVLAVFFLGKSEDGERGPR